MVLELKHPYKKLIDDYDHLQQRTIDLFREGKRKEGKLLGVIANAWKHCDRMTARDNDHHTMPEEVYRELDELKQYLARNLRGDESTDLPP